MRKLTATCFLVASAALIWISLPGATAAPRPRPAAASESVHLSGPVVVRVQDLPEPSASISGSPASAPPRIASPRLEPGGPVPAANAIDTTGTVASAPAQATGFEGLSNSDNLTLVGLDLSPPDVQIAVGPSHIVEFINSVGRVFDRNGAQVQTFALSGFFSVTPFHLGFDPKLIYDARGERWLATYVSRLDRQVGHDEGALYLAVSQSSDPTGVWNVYRTGFEDIFPDQPGLGLTDDKVTVSANMGDIDTLEPEGASGPAGITCTGFCGEQTFVFQKSDLLSGLPSSQVGRFAFPIRGGRFAVRPAHSLTATDDQYLGMFSTTSRYRLEIIRITGTPNDENVSEASVTELTVMAQRSPPPSVTAGTANCIIFDQNNGPPPCVDSGDYRLLEAVWRDNNMWLAAPAACDPPGDNATRSCAHLIEVETEDTPSKTQDIMYGVAGEYYSWPAIRTTERGDLIVALSHTNASIFAELRVAGREAADGSNTMQGSTLIRAGETVHTSGRWGDYQGAAVDPEHPNCVWIAGEVARVSLGRDWSTYISSAGYDDGCTAGPSTATPVTAVSGSPTSSASTTPPTRTRTATPTQTPTPMPRYGDVSCDVAIDSIDAVLILQFDARLVGSLRCQQNADVNQDGRVSALDASLILQYSAGLILSLPP